MSAAYDVFLSHNSRDKALVRQVASALKARGVTAWLDEEALTPGRRWKREIQDALSAARSIAVLIGSEGFGPWHEMEADVYLGRAVKEEKPFIPVLLPGAPAAGELTGFRAEFTAVDLRDGVTPEGIDRLVRGIRGAGASSRSSDGLWTVPHPRNPHFTGREEILAELHARLTAAGPVALSQAITGLGGVGKTQTAAEYCHRHRDDYRHVLWIDAESTSSLTDAYGDLARRLALVTEAEVDSDRILGSVLDWLDRQDECLLVLDNVEAPDTLRPFLPTGARTKVLITTRSASLSGLGIDKAIALEVLMPRESVAFLLERSAGGDRDREAATELAAELGHLPLALEQAAAYVKEYGVAFSAYLSAWRRRRFELLERQGPQEGGYRATVATTWAVCFAQVEEASVAAADVLRVVAFLAPDAIPEELFTEAAGHLGPSLSAKAEELKDALAIGELLAPLARVSLIRRQPEERIFSVHRLVQEAVRAALAEKEREEWLGRAVEGLNVLVPDGVQSPSTWPRYRRLSLHVQAVAVHLGASGSTHASAGSLLSEVGFYLWSQGRHSEARSLEDRVVTVYQRELGGEHPDTLCAMNNLAATLQALGDLSGARDLQERVLATCCRELGEEHPDTLGSMNNLAATLQAQGDLPGARDLLEQVLATCRLKLGEEHADTLIAMNNLAATMRAQQDLSKARELHERVLAIRRRVLGKEHPETLRSINNLGITLTDLGDLSSAHVLLRDAVEGARRILGEDHPHTQRWEENLAALEAKLT